MLDELLRAFLDKHPHLEDDMFADRGIQLMRSDSQIAEEVIGHFVERDIPILCIHDSFIVPHNRTLELREVMADVTTHQLGGPLEVSQDFPGIDQFVRDAGIEHLQAYWRIRGLPERSEGYLRRLRRFRERLPETAG